MKMYNSWILEDYGPMDENGEPNVNCMSREKLICPSCGETYVILFPEPKRECEKCGAKILRSRFIPFIDMEMLKRYEEEDNQFAKENGYEISDFKEI